MIVTLTQEERQLLFEFIAEKHDTPVVNERISMAERQSFVTLPEKVNMDDIHPDLLALTAILMVYPFSKSLQLPFGVSEQFAHIYRDLFKKNVGPIDAGLKPRKSTESSSPGIAYSGGVDSSAALALLPHNTKAFFLDRPVKRNSLYSSEAAHFACKEIAKLGYTVHVIGTDLEYLRKPDGFPVDWSTAVPAVILADHEDLDSVAFGTILESAYGIGKGRFQELREKVIYWKWMELFSAVDLPLNLVTAGVSEVGTQIITQKVGFSLFAQSCIRGSIGEPCKNCWKCFRKGLCELALQRNDPSEDEVEKLFCIKDAQNNLRNVPIKHENVLTYATAYYSGNDDTMRALQKRVRGDKKEVGWMEKWYPAAIEYTIPKYREVVAENARHILGEMTDDDIQALVGWDLLDVVDSDSYQEACNNLNKSIESRFPEPSDRTNKKVSLIRRIARKLHTSVTRR